MIEVKNRSAQSWGPLANLTDKEFDFLTSRIDTKKRIKVHLKERSKLKPFKVTFIKQLVSDSFEILAESEYDVLAKAKVFFEQNKDTIEFAPTVRSAWEQRVNPAGYDNIQLTKVRS